MSEVITNQLVARDFYMLKVAEPNEAAMGQFYMLRAWGAYPLLSRPLSVFDSDGTTLSFLYKVVGEGTERLSRLRPGDELSVGRALGNTFPSVKGKIAMVGGGVGIAPLHLAAKTLKRDAAETTVDMFLGFNAEPLLVTEYSAFSDRVVINIGGLVTNEIDPSRYDCVLSCGPEVMMRVLYEKCRATRTKLYVSLESKMACGIGLCLGCSCKSKSERKKICTDGPVFSAEEVF